MQFGREIAFPNILIKSGSIILSLDWPLGAKEENHYPSLLFFLKAIRLL